MQLVPVPEVEVLQEPPPLDPRGLLGCRFLYC